VANRCGPLQAELERATQDEQEGSSTDLAIARLREKAAGKRNNKAIIDSLNRVRERVELAARDAVLRLGEGYEPSIERRLTTISNMNTWIRCGVEAVYEGRTIDTPFLISAVGEEVVVQELLLDRKEGDIRARVPISDPEAEPELHEVIIDIIIANVNKESV